jgi:hypothetical protein
MNENQNYTVDVILDEGNHESETFDNLPDAEAKYDEFRSTRVKEAWTLTGRNADMKFVSEIILRDSDGTKLKHERMDDKTKKWVDQLAE